MIAFDVLPAETGLIGRLALEVTVVVGVAAAVQSCLASAAWRRADCQICLLGLFLILMGEFTGITHYFGTRLARTDSSKPAVQSSTATTSDFALPIREEFLKRVTARLTSPSRERAEQDTEASSDASAGQAPEISRISTAAGNDEVNAGFHGWVAALWLLGAGLIFARFGLGQLAFRLVCRRQEEGAEAGVEERIAALSARLGVKRKVKCVVLPRISAPMAFGILRPAIGLPARFAQKFDRDQQAAMLAHELGHLASHDPAWHFFCLCVTALLWWHPLVWWIRSHRQ